MFLHLILISILVTSCQSKSKPLQEQIIENFRGRLKNIDSSLVLDSFRIFRTDTITERAFLIHDDSMYARELARTVRQLNYSLKGDNSDSIKFLKSEIELMKKEIDSFEKPIKNADSIKKYGVALSFSYQLKNNNKSEKDSAFYSIDNQGNILNSDFIDTLIKRASERLK
jgi:hypothetical protein